MAAAALAAGYAKGRHPDSPGRQVTREADEAVLAPAIRAVADSQLSELDAALGALSASLEKRDRQATDDAFRSARTAYKRAEWLLTAYSPQTVAVLNGPAAESDGDSPPPPLGAPADFQRIADGLAARAPEKQLRAIVSEMREVTGRFRAQTPMVTVGPRALLDAVRAEVGRVSTLGIAGADIDGPGRAAEESAEALQGMVPLAIAAGRHAAIANAAPAWDATADALRLASAQLRADPGFARRDRLAFIAGDLASVARALGRVHAALPAEPYPRRRAWRQDAAFVFDSSAFDASAYAPEFAPPTSGALVALGKRLFFDPRLSGPQSRSCSSCHDPARAFTDGRPRALTLRPDAQAAARNTPTLINVAFEPALFADQRAGSLEDQVGRVLASPAEMQSSAELAATRLGGDAAYRSAFESALGSRSDTAVTPLGVRIALAAYVRSLVALNSRFDRAARGDTNALNATERRGFDLFMGRARCGSCHFAPLFSGVTPPGFVTAEPEVIGVPRDSSARNLRIDDDVGRAGFDNATAHRFAFKVPTLRNITLTAPYMHNGVFATLEQVIDFYDRGGGVGLGLTVPTQTLSPVPLKLRAEERRDLIAFLGTLTDTILPRTP